ncbi:MAG: S1-like domain-containing RNA-binding protein [Prevotellaceae bacterium]|nr:S1-like domain-containing RNA-binding protein [Prevotellaceae bacterium]
MRDKDELQIGRTCQLKVNRQVEFGFYLDGGEQYGEVLLPNGEIRPDIDVHIGEPLEVFLYLDTQERIVATTHMPLAQVGDFAYLEVAWVNNFGAFLHWGPQKDLFVPFREQKMKMMKGHSYIVHVHLDPETYRIMASAKVEHFLSQDFPPYRTGDQVELLIWQKTDLGLKAIVDGRYGGLLYDTQMFRTLRTGDRVKGYISQVRPDGKLDLSLQCPGQRGVEDFSAQLLRHLQMNGGQTPLGDKSPAEEIYALFGVSKKVFKKAVGDLYRQRLIEISDTGIRLTPQGKSIE